LGVSAGRPPSFTQDTAEIYALLDPRCGSVRYIGKANNSTKRLQSHIRDARRRKTPVYSWIGKLAGLGLVPGIRILRTIPRQDWPAAEREEIAAAKRRGERLLNLAEGGDQPHCPTETRQANGSKNARAIHDDPRRKRIWSLKREIGSRLKNGLVSESGKEKLRRAARKAPHLFGEFAAI
jgi:hypothetical protein